MGMEFLSHTVTYGGRSDDEYNVGITHWMLVPWDTVVFAQSVVCEGVSISRSPPREKKVKTDCNSSTVYHGLLLTRYCVMHFTHLSLPQLNICSAKAKINSKMKLEEYQSWDGETLKTHRAYQVSHAPQSPALSWHLPWHLVRLPEDKATWTSKTIPARKGATLWSWGCLADEWGREAGNRNNGCSWLILRGAQAQEGSKVGGRPGYWRGKPIGKEPSLLQF